MATDLDGTLARIVPVPSAARLVPGASEALHALARRLAVVAVITGRAALDARRILGSARNDVLVIGNHGLEWLEADADVPAFDQRLVDLHLALADVVARIPAFPGVEVEDKGLSATIHYRRAPDPDAARVQLLAALREMASASFEIREGRRSIELRIAGRGDKGSAVRELVERFRLRGLVVAGDDVTDLDMFFAARNLEAAGLKTAVLSVSGGHEVPAVVADSADVLLPDPEDFVRLLETLATIR